MPDDVNKQDCYEFAEWISKNAYEFKHKRWIQDRCLDGYIEIANNTDELFYLFMKEKENDRC